MSCLSFFSLLNVAVCTVDLRNWDFVEPAVTAELWRAKTPFWRRENSLTACNQRSNGQLYNRNMRINRYIRLIRKSKEMHSSPGTFPFHLTARSRMCLNNSPGMIMVVQGCWETHFWSYYKIKGLTSCSIFEVKSHLYGVNSMWCIFKTCLIMLSF